MHLVRLGNRPHKGSERWARILGEIEETPYQKPLSKTPLPAVAGGGVP